MFLLDTNVVSELRRPVQMALYLPGSRTYRRSTSSCPAVTVGEIQAGIEITREQDLAKAEELEDWLDKVLASAPCCRWMRRPLESGHALCNGGQAPSTRTP